MRRTRQDETSPQVHTTTSSPRKQCSLHQPHQRGLNGFSFPLPMSALIANASSSAKNGLSRSDCLKASSGHSSLSASSPSEMSSNIMRGSISTSLSALIPGSCRLMAAIEFLTLVMISSPSPASSSRGSARMIMAASARGSRSFSAAMRVAITDWGVSRIAGKRCATAMASPGVQSSNWARACTRCATSTGVHAAAAAASNASAGVMAP
mmetsp:Transcript_24716/g.60810  ORF Transcript_24716/g.60810 Transcript_24716/m.60810 type:complete len:209 (+) Transcript_24716:594-1220(+)